MDFAGFVTERTAAQRIKGLNEEIRWVKREIRRASSNVPRQAKLQFYRYLLRRDARACHLTLASFNLERKEWAKTHPRKTEKREEHSEAEYSYSLAG